VTFDATTTADEVLAGRDLTGTEFLITGASGGIGLETARALAAHGARVTLAARDRGKLDAALARVLEELPDARIDGAIVDLADLASVRRFTADFLAERDRLDVLVNNAGVMFPPLSRTADGFELQFGTNHLAHFLLTALLFPLLRGGANGGGTGARRVRVVNVSSEGHRRAGVDLGDPNFIARDYDKFVGYGQSKTANILFGRELDRRAEASGVHAFSLHPGRIATDLGRHMTHDDMVALMERAKAASSGSGMPEFKSIPQGAATTVYAAVTEGLDEHGGAYLSDCALAEPADWARDDATGLWDLSESLVSEQWSPA
jgi:NAD(P)-dependent dehydrogenase (short-subunit alcohol dehydrogenase family)